MERIRIGISSCLLGEPVRWDGNHKRDPYIAETLSRVFELVPVCPEVAIGLGVPRPPIRLSGNARSPRAIASESPERDVTAELSRFARKTAHEQSGLAGYLFKSGSPSCGLRRVAVHSGRGRPAQIGEGVYSREICRKMPMMPVEDEIHLGIPERRDSFVERVCAYRRWQDTLAEGLSLSRLKEFHDRHALTLLAHGADAAQGPGAILRRARNRQPSAVARDYGAAFMDALRRPATRRGHARALRFALRALRPVLASADQAELAGAIDSYRHEGLPWLVPLTLLRHHLERHPQPELKDQAYLTPDLPEQMLRSYA
jgi:uncharacterized protein YbbK (DUF523 family)/uncharacterized protein YbgA (DUF1722 family)